MLAQKKPVLHGKVRRAVIVGNRIQASRPGQCRTSRDGTRIDTLEAEIPS